MGHVIQLRREGVPATAPLFIPFLGAVVGMKGLPQATPGSRPRSASPARCSAPSAPAACLALAVALDSDLLRALAYTGFLLNLFNLIPVLPLDGGRAAAAVHPAFWFVGLFAVALLFFMHGSTILLLIAGLGGYELYHRWRRRNDEEFKAYHNVTRNQRIAVGVVYLGADRRAGGRHGRLVHPPHAVRKRGLTPFFHACLKPQSSIRDASVNSSPPASSTTAIIVRPPRVAAATRQRPEASVKPVLTPRAPEYVHSR